MKSDVAIVGGGAAGVLCAIHLLRRQGRPLRIALIEKASELGEGIAYSTRRPEHLLNVTAGRMSAIDEDPMHFVRYLGTHASDGSAADALAATFIERRRYADYLRATLASEQTRSASELQVIRDEAVSIGGEHDLRIALRSGGALEARCAILALGNWPGALPFPRQRDLPAASVQPGWDAAAIADLDLAQDVLVAGSGLSMVDAVLTLAANGHAGRIHVVSRHALLPLPHAPHGGIALDIAALSRMPLSRRVATLRSHARDAIAHAMPWQWVMDTLRNENASLWQSLALSEQRRFLRHASRYWDVHRHRIPPSAATAIAALLRSGQMTTHAARIASVGVSGGRLQIGLARRRSAWVESVFVDRLINCTGMQKDMRRVANDLIVSLFERGLVRCGPHGIGLDTDADGQLIGDRGRSHPGLFTLGSARIGRLWESVAIPELRVQAAALAEQVQRRLTSGSGSLI